MRQVLFLCTGNYYRSRYAEAVFNHLAAREQIDARAISRGLRIDRTGMNVGPISKHAIERLRRREIALKEAEHRAMLEANFPGWADRVEYWHVHDLDLATPDEALAMIEAHVERLIERIRQETRPR